MLAIERSHLFAKTPVSSRMLQTPSFQHRLLSHAASTVHQNQKPSSNLVEGSQLLDASLEFPQQLHWRCLCCCSLHCRKEPRCCSGAPHQMLQGMQSDVVS